MFGNVVCYDYFQFRVIVVGIYVVVSEDRVFVVVIVYVVVGDYVVGFIWINCGLCVIFEYFYQKNLFFVSWFFVGLGIVQFGDLWELVFGFFNLGDIVFQGGNDICFFQLEGCKCILEWQYCQNFVYCDFIVIDGSLEIIVVLDGNLDFLIFDLIKYCIGDEIVYLVFIGLVGVVVVVNWCFG